MLDLERALNQDRLLRALTGLNRKAFDALLPNFEQAYEASRIAAKPVRKRAGGDGRKARLSSIEAKLFYILFYFKCYPTFDLAGILFDLDRSQTHEWMHELQPVLEAALGTEMVLPERKLRSLEAFMEVFPGVERVMIDGTERPVQRPKDTEQQTLNYSGKKRRHTRKHLAAVDQTKRVLVLSKAREGKLHDKRFETEEEIAFHIPDEIPIEVDLGFQGLQSEYTNIRIPHKKPRGGELTNEQKQENRSLSQSRVVCENAFAGIKRYRAVSAIYRNHIQDFDDHLMLTAAGLWNFYLKAA
ncbi:transposase family protein [Leptolyngbya sp. FACHB-17]|uniref:transposase family protein n=1 Tax=unclassified Leptolyngbya TaxID=2650499 RepID=UPI0016812253|nr:transposase family protein [Leptolyngbya sp. FACHB-17]MBD2081736.1 transposase family protein [Leptolyngbya sp. FACHB-17]